MKKLIVLVCAAALLTGQTFAQMGAGGMGMGPRPKLGGSTEKLFGDHKAFSAKMEMTAKGKKASENMTMPGTMAFDEGKSRFEMDITQAKGGAMNAEMAPQLKQMGMDRMVMVSRPDLKVNYMIYPGLKSYLTMPGQEATKEEKDKMKVEMTELGKETIDGRACVKSRAVVTDADGKKHEALVWKATDLKDFPVKIEQAEEGTEVTLLFKDVKLEKPSADLFEAPKGFTKHENMQSMMQEMMTRMMDGKK